MRSLAPLWDFRSAKAGENEHVAVLVAAPEAAGICRSPRCAWDALETRDDHLQIPEMGFAESMTTCHPANNEELETGGRHDDPPRWSAPSPPRCPAKLCAPMNDITDERGMELFDI